jgi:hypothetical protein
MIYTPPMTPFSRYPSYPNTYRIGEESSSSDFFAFLYELFNKIFSRTTTEGLSISSTSAESSYDLLDATESVTSMIEPSIMGLCEYLEIDISHPGEIVGYLKHYPGMYLPVMLTCLLAHEEFGEEGTLSLEVYHDPEVSDEYPTLTIRQRQYSVDLLGRIEMVSDCVQPYLSGEAGWILLTTDFLPITI